MGPLMRLVRAGSAKRAVATRGFFKAAMWTDLHVAQHLITIRGHFPLSHTRTFQVCVCCYVATSTSMAPTACRVQCRHYGAVFFGTSRYPTTLPVKIHKNHKTYQSAVNCQVICFACLNVRRCVPPFFYKNGGTHAATQRLYRSLCRPPHWML